VNATALKKSAVRVEKAKRSVERDIKRTFSKMTKFVKEHPGAEDRDFCLDSTIKN
jgi:hypothetical protein